MTDNNDIQCLCCDGYLSSNPTGGKFLQTDGVTCISCLLSPTVEVTAFTFTFSIETSTNITSQSLSRYDRDNDINVTLIEEKLSETTSADGNLDIFTFKNLVPGSRYTASLISESDTFVCPAVTSCSCTNNELDRTGRPLNLEIAQNNGHVIFNFTDNSYCEEAFSFTRSLDLEEFLRDVSLKGVSFTDDYAFNAGEACGTIITPVIECSDDLSKSELPIGTTFTYCVRAVKDGHYMDHPFAVDNLASRTLTSSDDTCASHKVRWEASIDGIITTEPTAGKFACWRCHYILAITFA
jgi:hypothetical protein